MKKFISSILALVMLFSLSATAFAADTAIDYTQKAAEHNGYTFQILEATTANHVVVRTYRNDAPATRAISSPEETKALLVTLGFDEERVNKLSAESLAEYANSPEIVVSTTYSKTDEINHITTNVTEDEALTESSRIQAERHAKLAQGVVPMSSDNENSNYYMKFTYVVTYIGNAVYLFESDAVWLNMPNLRGYDSIGSCAMNNTVTNSTRSGEYSYDITKVSGSLVTYDSDGADITTMKNQVTGDWYGSAGIFNLPDDYFSEGHSTAYDNFKAHYEYRSHVTSPDEQRWFNTIGTYSHATIALELEPSLQIELNKNGYSAVISLFVIGLSDTLSVEHEINYKP